MDLLLNERKKNIYLLGVVHRGLLRLKLLIYKIISKKKLMGKLIYLVWDAFYIYCYIIIIEFYKKIIGSFGFLW